MASTIVLPSRLSMNLVAIVASAIINIRPISSFDHMVGTMIRVSVYEYALLAHERCQLPLAHGERKSSI
jgi:hypothetical protein